MAGHEAVLAHLWHAHALGHRRAPDALGDGRDADALRHGRDADLLAPVRHPLLPRDGRDVAPGLPVLLVAFHPYAAVAAVVRAAVAAEDVPDAVDEVHD